MKIKESWGFVLPKCTRSVPHFEIMVLFVHFAMLPGRAQHRRCPAAVELRCRAHPGIDGRTVPEWFTPFRGRDVPILPESGNPCV